MTATMPTPDTNAAAAALTPGEQKALAAHAPEMQTKYLKIRNVLMEATATELWENLRFFLQEMIVDAGLIGNHPALLEANIAQLLEDLDTEGNAPIRPLYARAGIYA